MTNCLIFLRAIALLDLPQLRKEPKISFTKYGVYVEYNIISNPVGFKSKLSCNMTNHFTKYYVKDFDSSYLLY